MFDIDRKMWDKDELRMMLPKVGDRVAEREITAKPGENGELQRGTVTYVHRRHLWYAVIFDNGDHGSYKLPKAREGSRC